MFSYKDGEQNDRKDKNNEYAAYCPESVLHFTTSIRATPQRTLTAETAMSPNQGPPSRRIRQPDA